MTKDTTDRLLQTIPFGSRSIGPGLPVVVIAEIGINHEGDARSCFRMIEEAARAGADAIKLQTIDPRENYVPGTLSFELFSKAELSREDTARAFSLANELGMEALTTAGDFATLDWVETLEPAAHKISSGLLTHLPLIERVARTGRSMLMSTGMGGVEQAGDAIRAARAAGGKKIAIFQCTSIYPAPPESLNLRRMQAFAERFGGPVGLSDHTDGIEAAAIAVGAGAHMIEKHFTFDRTRPDYDHRLSLEPDGFALLVQAVRRAESMMGSGELAATDAQAKAAKTFQRSLVARRDIAKGEAFSQEMIGFMRTQPDQRGLPPYFINQVLGKIAACAISRHTALNTSDVLGLESES